MWSSEHTVSPKSCTKICCTPFGFFRANRHTGQKLPVRIQHFGTLAKASSSRLWGLLPPAGAGKNCARSRSPAPASQAFLQPWQSRYTLLLSAFWVLLYAQLSFLLSLGAHQLVQCRPCAKPLLLLESLLLGRTKPDAPENAVRGEATSTAPGGKV